MPSSPAPTTITTTTSASSIYPPPPPQHSPPFTNGTSVSPNPHPNLTPAQRTAEARAAFTASLRSAASHLDVELQARARDLHANAAALEKQERQIREQAQGLNKENVEMEALIEEQKAGLKELGIKVKEELLEVEIRDREEDVGGSGEPLSVGTKGFGDENGLGDMDDLEKLLKELEQDMSMLEETCRIVETGEDKLDEEPQRSTEEGELLESARVIDSRPADTT